MPDQQAIEEAAAIVELHDVGFAPNLTPAALAAATGPQEQTFNVPGLVASDRIVCTPPAPAANTAFMSARVSAADTLAITFFNNTAAANVPAAGTYLISAIRP